MIGSEEDVTRFDTETGGVFDPGPGEVIPPGTPAESEEPGIDLNQFITDEFVATIFAMPAGLMARKTGREWWLLDLEEKSLLGKGAGPAARYLVEKYLGGAGAFAALGMSLGVIYGPRIWAELELSRLKKAEESPSQREKPRTSKQESAASSADAGAESPQSSSVYSTAYSES
jgi:hypothetical protein